MTVCLKHARWAAILAASIAACSCGFHHTKYQNPVTKDTQQPDKVLYDKAVKDLQHGRYELARLTLNTLINTYDSSEFLAQAKLAIADSWFREGGASGLAQAEAEYKDFELFYPTMPEAAESQYKICMIHYQQMEKPDRDSNQVLRAEQECKQLVLQYPNSKYIPQAEQRLREIDEDLGESEMRVANQYYSRGKRAAAANRYTGLVDQYPLYSRADEALMKGGDSYIAMGRGLRPNAIQAYQKIVRDYPLSEYVDAAKKKLHDLEADVPQADPKAMARMKYEQENRTKTSTLHNLTGFLRPSPELSAAAKTGSPTLTPPKQNIPVNVPKPVGATGAAFNGDVTVAPVSSTTPSASANTPAPDATTAQPQATATNSKDGNSKDANSKDKKNDKKKDKKNQKQDPKQDQKASPNTDPSQVQTPGQKQ